MDGFCEFFVFFFLGGGGGFPFSSTAINESKKLIKFSLFKQ